MFKQSLKLLSEFLVLVLLVAAAGCAPSVEPIRTPTVEGPAEEPVEEPPTEQPTEEAPAEEPAPDLVEVDFYPESPDCQPVASRAYVALPGPGRLAMIEKQISYIPDQIIITGLKDDVINIAEASALSKMIKSKASISFTGLGGQGGESFDPPLPYFSPERVEDLSIGLFETTEDVLYTIEEVYRIATRMWRDHELEAGIFVAPNYVSGRPVSDPIYGTEWDPAGSPLEVDPGGAEVAGGSFHKQWALGKYPGINLFDAEGNRKVDARGDGTYIFILDTSRFSESGLAEFSAENWPQEPDGKMLELCVSHDSLFLPESPDEFGDARNHGVFVAGLAHVVAPNSTLHLVRALNDQGHGTLFQLADALAGVIGTTLKNTEDGQKYMEKTVINLSLGLNASHDMLKNHGSSALLMTKPQIPDDPEYQACPLSPEAYAASVALATPLAIARGHGAVIVASAGNDSADAQNAKPSRIPACYPWVISVAASNNNQDPGRSNRSCYSNADEIGAIAAPGGGRKEQVEDCTTDEFQDGFEWCTSENDKDCPYGVISLDPASPSGYAYWTGSSFAAPQVSGLAALLLGKGWSAQQVYDALKHDGSGIEIIDVDSTIR